jgi:hypothetical protein
MAQRRMFSKTITNSSQFLMMPQSSQNLYFHLGMNADDDGFCEHFTIMRMTDSKPDDLKILQAKSFIQIFDEKILIILDWKENNYLRSDRYTPSKYLEIYKEEIMRLTNGIPNGDTGKVRIGKVRIGKVIKTAPDGTDLYPELKIIYNNFLLSHGLTQPDINQDIWSIEKERQSISNLFKRFKDIEIFKAFLQSANNDKFVKDKSFIPSILLSQYSNLMLKNKTENKMDYSVGSF